MKNYSATKNAVFKGAQRVVYSIIATTRQFVNPFFAFLQLIVKKTS